VAVWHCSHFLPNVPPWAHRRDDSPHTPCELLVLGNARVAHVAVEVRVRAFEGKLETGKMIETGDAPDIVAMAIGTRGPSRLACLVIRLVAPGAILRYRSFRFPLRWQSPQPIRAWRPRRAKRSRARD